MAPQRARTAFLFYQTDHLGSIKRSLPPTSTMGEAMRLLSARWKSLSSEEKAPYLEREREDRERYDQECVEADEAAIIARSERQAKHATEDTVLEEGSSGREARKSMDEARAAREQREEERKRRIIESEDPEEREERLRLKRLKKKEAAERQKKRDAEESAVKNRHETLDKKMAERSKDRLQYLLGQSEIFARLTDGGKGGGTTMSSKSDSDTKQEKKKDHRAVATAAPVGEEEEDDDIDNGPSHVFLTKQPNCIKFGSLKPYQLEGLKSRLRSIELKL